ncbi:M16 family metallopeptidase [Pontixanthobacter luteolus]|uniref:M16 family metallopeptidase n=1 Tax=Pontixanthobacter luteolus TaxID=295089 RepID=UPI002303BEEC|nr:insulinase family protein [Pontixanthobacter luteolus]
MTKFLRAARHFALLLPLLYLAPQASAQQSAQEQGVQTAAEAGTEAAALSSLPAPKAVQIGSETPWIYEGSDVPRDTEWLFGEMDNGLRYATRENGVPPGQVSIRIRIDAGSLHEEDSERGFAHLLEHMSFRESKYLAQGAAIPTWQRLGASFGSDTNAETTPTHTVYKLDLPAATPASVEESFKLLAGMMQEPVLSEENLALDVPIVLAEMRERSGASIRAFEKSLQTRFAGQRLANRLTIGTRETLNGATAESISAFHDRWYRPENVVISVAGDFEAETFASLIEKYFGDWEGKGPLTPAPDFGDPVAPAGADPENPVGEVAVIVEPDLPRSMTYTVMRPWRPVQDTIVYNEGLLMDALAQALINRRLEARARAGGSYLYAQVRQEDVSRSTDSTFVAFAPLTGDWQSALKDVRGVIEDALAAAPSEEEIAREFAEFEKIYESQVEQRTVMQGSKLADDIINAVDIREAVAAPETVLQVFRGMRERITPERILERTRALFEGDVIRTTYITPAADEATDAAVRAAMLQEVAPNSDVRLAAETLSFADLPPIGEPGTIVSTGPLGVLGIERIEFDNGTRALLWPNDGEPGRVSVKMRFGAGMRAFDQEDAPYISLGESALVGQGFGELGQEELDRISTGRVMGFDFAVEDAVFSFSAQTRNADLADQLYLFAGKLAMPRWDANPVNRMKAAQRLSYESYAANAGGILTRDLEYYLRNEDARFKTFTPTEVDTTTPERFREVWAPLLSQGDVEVIIFGDFQRDAAVEALRNTVGALPQRTPIPAEIASRVPTFPAAGEGTKIITHRGDATSAAAVVAWPSGAGVEQLRESRQLEILTDLFNNRLLDAMRERAGASYSPSVNASWPVDLDAGGRIMALAQLKPEDVPVFFAASDAIARDLAVNPPTADELARVTEPLKQLVTRIMTSNQFWLYQIEGSSKDRRKLLYLQTLLSDYSQTTPERMQELAQKYFANRPAYRLAILPDGQELAGGGAARAAEITGR